MKAAFIAGPQHDRVWRAAAMTTRVPSAMRLSCVRSRSQLLSPVCQTVHFPAALPVLPFPLTEVLPPGSSKVLRLSNSSSMILLEELLTSTHGMAVHSCVLDGPGAGGGSAGGGGEGPSGLGSPPPGWRLGSYETGKWVFCLSTIIKVIEMKPAGNDVLLRVQAEGRVAVKSLSQAGPYCRAVVVPITDNVDLDRLQAPYWREICGAVEQLRSLMRDIQKLAAKFNTPETANLQRAMIWVDNRQPLVFSSSSLLLNSRTTPNHPAPHTATTSATTEGPGASSQSSPPTRPLPSDEDFQPSEILAPHIQPDADSGNLSTSGSESETDTLYAAAAATGGELPLPPVESLPGAAAGGLAAAEILSSGGVGGIIRTRPSLLDLERACRLSLAAFQLLPTATEEERAAIKGHQAAALETQDVLERLHLALAVMGEARGVLAAKCALMTLNQAA